jgi:ribose transport system substrate-binding protein
MERKQRMSKITLPKAAFALVASTFLIGNLSSAKADYKLAGFSGLASDAYWISLMCGGTKTAAKAGSTIDWYSVTKGNDANEALANFEALKVSKPDGVVISQWSTEPPAGYAKALMDAGVPVVYVNGQPAKDRSYLTGYRSAPADNKMAEVADKILADTGGNGEFVVLGGIAGLPPEFTSRFTVLQKILSEKAKNLKQLDTQYEQFDANKANEIVSALLVSSPKLKVVWATSGPAGQGAAAAIKAAGKSGQVLVYSFDAVPLLQAAVRDGTVKALVAQPPRLQAEQAVATLIKYLDDHKGSKGPVSPDTANQDQQIDTMIITRDNIDSPEAQGYLYKDKCE